MRWASDFEKLHQHLTDICVKSLSDHLRSCRAAQRLGLVSDLRAVDQTPLQSDLADVEAWGDLVPTNLKHKVLDWSLEKMTANANSEGFMMAVCPWLGGDATGDEPQAFSTLRPRLAQIEGSKHNIATTFRGKVIGFMTTLVRRGKDSVEDLRKAIQQILGFLDEHQVPDAESDDEGDEDTRFDEAVDAINKTGRALMLLACIGTALLQKAHLAAANDLRELLAAKDLKGEKAARSFWCVLSGDIDRNTDFCRSTSGVVLGVPSQVPTALGGVDGCGEAIRGEASDRGVRGLRAVVDRSLEGPGDARLGGVAKRRGRDC